MGLGVNDGTGVSVGDVVDVGVTGVLVGMSVGVGVSVGGISVSVGGSVGKVVRPGAVVGDGVRVAMFGTQRRSPG